MHNSLAYVQPSREESQPISILEAMAQGGIVVATDVGGVSEIVANGKNGFLYQLGDNRRFVQIINQIQHAKVPEAIHREAKRTAEAHKFSLIARKIVMVYSAS
jgi:glycosyltransferase involved in cell wall biosynthesis